MGDSTTILYEIEHVEQSVIMECDNRYNLRTQKISCLLKEGEVSGGLKRLWLAGKSLIYLEHKIR